MMINKNSREGLGLWVQLSTETQDILYEKWRKRELMSVDEKLQEMKELSLRGFELMKEALEAIQQEANIKFVNNNGA